MVLESCFKRLRQLEVGGERKKKKKKKASQKFEWGEKWQICRRRNEDDLSERQLSVKKKKVLLVLWCDFLLLVKKDYKGGKKSNLTFIWFPLTYFKVEDTLQPFWTHLNPITGSFPAHIYTSEVKNLLSSWVCVLVRVWFG